MATAIPGQNIGAGGNRLNAAGQAVDDRGNPVGGGGGGNGGQGTYVPGVGYIQNLQWGPHGEGSGIKDGSPWSSGFGFQSQVQEQGGAGPATTPSGAAGGIASTGSGGGDVTTAMSGLINAISQPTEGTGNYQPVQGTHAITAGSMLGQRILPGDERILAGLMAAKPRPQQIY